MSPFWVSIFIVGAAQGVYLLLRRHGQRRREQDTLAVVANVIAQDDHFDALESAAKSGAVDAQYNLGYLYENGTGSVPQSFALAMEWYRRAAEQGDSQAQNNIGVMYLEGKGVPMDDAAAVHWFSKAAEQGNALSQWVLAGLYSNGRGVGQSNVLAYLYLCLAEQNDGTDESRKQRAVGFKQSISSGMSPEQLGEATRLFLSWKSKLLK